MDAGKARGLPSLSLEELISIADRVRRENVGEKIELCSLINAKSGACSEDCKFCVQSSHYSTKVTQYSLKDESEIISAATLAKKNGAKHFDIVTSGRRLTSDEINRIACMITKIREEIGIIPCASLGALSEESLQLLKNAGLARYNHNIETSRRFYPFIVSTHDYSERVNTVKTAKRVGLEVCSGGIIGMGETWDDRIDMALLLKELDVDTVPLNFLVPREGTPFENISPISPYEAIKAIAIFRIILEQPTIKVVAGRETVLRDFQTLAYIAGANGMMIGGYLTISGRPVEQDLALVSEITRLWKNK